MVKVHTRRSVAGGISTRTKVVGLIVVIGLFGPMTLLNRIHNSSITSSQADDDDEDSSNDDGSSFSQDPLANADAQERIAYFKKTAASLHPITDKVGGETTISGQKADHKYHNMYGQFLLPFAAAKPHFKFLEIGKGCTMDYGPGASVQLWKILFPHAELWEAEYEAACIQKAQERKQLDGVHTLVGDQGDIKVLDSWIEESGGKFDIIVDDGGHKNCQISNSFDRLWPQLNPGGYYFIEDLHVGQTSAYKCKDTLPVSERLAQWQLQLIYSSKTHEIKHQWKDPLPEDMMFVHCQSEACVLHKRYGDVNDPI